MPDQREDVFRAMRGDEQCAECRTFLRNVKIGVNKRRLCFTCASVVLPCPGCGGPTKRRNLIMPMRFSDSETAHVCQYCCYRHTQRSGHGSRLSRTGTLLEWDKTWPRDERKPR